MPTYVILLRAVNVGGTGKLPMADFKKVLTALGIQECGNLHSERQCGGGCKGVGGNHREDGGRESGKADGCTGGCRSADA